MSYQFIHIEAYARGKTTQKKATATKRTLREVIAEAKRETDSCAHVAEPKAPLLLYGKSLDDVEAEALDWAETYRDSKNRKARADAFVIVAGVISIPKTDKENWEEFKKTSIEYLKNKYKDDLKSVIEHTDEEHPHLHFYVVPKKGHKIDTIHEGIKARNEAKKELEKLKKLRKKTTDQNELYKIDKAFKKNSNAYKDAMRQFQDDFNKKVASKFGFTRIGPGRRRLTRKEWIEEKKQAKALADMSKNKEIAIKSLKEDYKKSFIVYHKKKIDEAVKNLNFLDKIKLQWHKPSNNIKLKNLDLEKINKNLQEENEKRIEEIQQQKNLLDKKTTYFNDIIKEKDKEIEECKKTINKQQKQLEEIAKKFNCSIEELKDILEEDLKNQSTIARTKKRTF